jgi:hypothetical protein
MEKPPKITTRIHLRLTTICVFEKDRIQLTLLADCLKITVQGISMRRDNSDAVLLSMMALSISYVVGKIVPYIA